jgi:hypothetical protein
LLSQLENANFSESVTEKNPLKIDQYFVEIIKFEEMIKKITKYFTCILLYLLNHFVVLLKYFQIRRINYFTFLFNACIKLLEKKINIRFITVILSFMKRESERTVTEIFQMLQTVSDPS